MGSAQANRRFARHSCVAPPSAEQLLPDIGQAIWQAWRTSCKQLPMKSTRSPSPHYRGKAMAYPQQLTAFTEGLYLCDPRSPWKHRSEKKLKWFGSPRSAKSYSLPSRRPYLHCAIAHGIERQTAGDAYPTLPYPPLSEYEESCLQTLMQKRVPSDNSTC